MAVKEQAKHTPGPWELEKRECQSLGSIHYAIKTSYKPPEHGWSPRFIAWMAGSLGESLPRRRPDDYRDDPQVEADALLMAASPDLLRELKKADRLLTMCLTVLNDARIAGYIPGGLKEDVQAFVCGNFGGAVIRKAEGR